MGLTLLWTSIPNWLPWWFFLFLSNPAHGDGAQALCNALKLWTTWVYQFQRIKLKDNQLHWHALGLWSIWWLLNSACQTAKSSANGKTRLARRACTCREWNNCLGNWSTQQLSSGLVVSFLRTVCTAPQGEVATSLHLFDSSSRADLCWWDCFL